MSRLQRSAGALLLTAALCLVTSTGPAAADTTESPPTSTEPTSVTSTPVSPSSSAAAEPAEGTVDLRVTVAFDKAGYFADEQVTGSVTLTNAGTATADHAWLEVQGFPVHLPRVPGPIDPGQTHEGTFNDYVTTTDAVLTIVVTAHANVVDANPADNSATAAASITVVLGTYAGTVYGDGNGNAVMDPGEALAGVQVSTGGGRPLTTHAAVTDGSGRFRFDDLPRGDYWTRSVLEPWVFLSGYTAVDGVDDPDVVVRGAHPIREELTASAVLDRQTYRLGDLAHLTLSLTNSGAVQITAVTSNCGHLGPTGSELGALALGGPGVTLPPGTTRIFEVPYVIGSATSHRGYTEVACTFGSPPHHNGSAFASAFARVPGMRVEKVDGIALRHLFVSPPWPVSPLPPVPGGEVYLRDRTTGAVLARATTADTGRFSFHDVPVGRHDIGVVGPWKIMFSTTFEVSANDDQPPLRMVFVEPGPYQPDPRTPLPPPPASGPGGVDPPAGAAGELAATGVDVTWLALGGLAAFVLGAVLVLGVRRGVV
ncbi:hypothetical protein [Saccharothrix sp. Mg75]|uniref:hypothetical protein n=1 Tax=Saccharothrix sp. Mg75 TaxID=3445357 RepID=UPI003EEDA4EE